MSSAHLTPLQANELHLLLAGAYREAARYQLPGSDIVVATLRVPASAVSRSIELIDQESAVVGHLEVDETRVDGDQCWVAGVVTPARIQAPTTTEIDSSTESTGIVVLLTGLSGSGKSTIAQALANRLESESRRRVTMLDGDEVRTLLSSDLGFSRAHRELNLRRLGWVASIASKHGGIAICPVIAPYASSRAEVRSMATAAGRFLLVHVATPLEVCELRDCKGLYARARAGELQNFTGVSDPYEDPLDADLTLDTSTVGVAECVDRIWDLCFRDAILDHGNVAGAEQ